MKTQINKEIIMALFILMLNYENANSKEYKSRIFPLIENATDSVARVEERVLEDRKWIRQINPSDLEIESENRLSVENWMVDEKLWSGSLKDETEIKDKELKIENWMLNPSYWEK